MKVRFLGGCLLKYTELARRLQEEENRQNPQPKTALPTQIPTADPMPSKKRKRDDNLAPLAFDLSSLKKMKVEEKDIIGVEFFLAFKGVGSERKSRWAPAYFVELIHLAKSADTLAELKQDPESGEISIMLNKAGVCRRPSKPIASLLSELFHDEEIGKPAPLRFHTVEESLASIPNVFRYETQLCNSIQQGYVLRSKITNLLDFSSSNTKKRFAFCNRSSLIF